ncbi:SMP-30/gluconolactonase/LRE family protein [Actinoplanes sp. CA-030573]|uniref:SMP-30/gluconolactonase/LRE family protein n=1 Tax=Actinoplanes sp. CA-030573 TaxID=3239898 RepID=UPI003D8B3354
MIDVVQITDAIAYHGEGPGWDPAHATLRWVDMLSGDLLSLSVNGSVERRHMSSVLAAWRPRAAGGVVMAVERGFATADANLDEVHELTPLWHHRRIRMNDGGCDPQGRFHCGTMAYDATPGAGRIHRLDPDGSARVVLDGVTVSNGLVWSRDGTTVYYVDSAVHSIDAFTLDPDDGTFIERRTVVAIDPALGTPDGITIDADGGLWVALWDGAAVHRYTSDGRLDEVLPLPTPRVTACAFGGNDLTDLYITTSRFEMTDPDKAAGALFVAKPGINGHPLPQSAI